MAESRDVPLVYADADVFLQVLLDQDHAEDALAVLKAAERGDIKLVASRLLAVEVGGWGGNRPGLEHGRALVATYLELSAKWVELDIIAAQEAQEVAWMHKLRASDAVHLATAIRRKADYFMSYDEAFPFGKTLGQTEVIKPRIVWHPTLEDTAAKATD